MAGQSRELSPSAAEAVCALQELAAKTKATISEAGPSDSDVSDYDDDATAERFKALAQLLESKLTESFIFPSFKAAANFVARFNPLRYCDCIICALTWTVSKLTLTTMFALLTFY